MDIQLLEDAFQAINSAIGLTNVDAAVILGSGWSDAANAFEILAEMPYCDIPAMGSVDIAGHKGRILLVRTGQRRVLIFQGRRHWYEGFGWTPVALPVYITAKAGARAILITNAAGGIRADLEPGELMLITDHINAIGANPLSGPHHAIWGRRFPDQSQLYDPTLNAQLRESASESGMILREGVYLATSGPCYETPAEVRAFQCMGADAVGMSTVPETILAGAAGLRTAAISCIANKAAGMSVEPLNHEAVLETTTRVIPLMQTLLLHTVTHANI